ncbi:hypothetical protein ACLKA6_000164 [Drosophila palustris]
MNLAGIVPQLTGIVPRPNTTGPMDATSKFVWLFPKKTTSCEEAVKKIETWSAVFGNPVRVVSDRGAAFTANQFADFIKTNNIEHVLGTTGVPRGNGQVERVNRVVLSIIAKMSAEDPTKWYQAVPLVQKAINSHVHSTTKRTPFELVFGIKMRNRMLDDIKKCLDEELYEGFERERQEMRDDSIESSVSSVSNSATSSVSSVMAKFAGTLDELDDCIEEISISSHGTGFTLTIALVSKISFRVLVLVIRCDFHFVKIQNAYFVLPIHVHGIFYKEITKFKMPGWMSTERNDLSKVDNDGSGNPFLIKWRYVRGPAAGDKWHLKYHHGSIGLFYRYSQVV